MSVHGLFGKLSTVLQIRTSWKSRSKTDPAVEGENLKLPQTGFVSLALDQRKTQGGPFSFSFLFLIFLTRLIFQGPTYQSSAQNIEPAVLVSLAFQLCGANKEWQHSRTGSASAPAWRGIGSRLCPVALVGVFHFSASKLPYL